jgi:hypothetical protein
MECANVEETWTITGCHYYAKKIEDTVCIIALYALWSKFKGKNMDGASYAP